MTDERKKDPHAASEVNSLNLMFTAWYNIIIYNDTDTTPV